MNSVFSLKICILASWMLDETKNYILVLGVFNPKDLKLYE